MKHGEASPPPDAAHALFGKRLAIAAQYVEALATVGVARGLIGPREANRLWERHVLNSAALAELVKAGERVVDIGSGAGLPGIPLAIARPDITVTLVEPMQRRTEFLHDMIQELGLAPTVSVVRGRAEDPSVIETVGDADAVTSRAVASLDKIGRWSLPLMRVGGALLAIKGDRAEDEVRQFGSALSKLGADDVRVVQCGTGFLDSPTTVVVARRKEGSSSLRQRGARSRKRNKRAAGDDNSG